MADMIRKGKIRHWGLSNETSYGTTMICMAADRLNCPRPISIQNSFSLVDRRFETELAEVCTERHLGIPLLPWSPGAGGILSGKYLNGNRPEKARMSRLGDRYSRFLSGRMEKAVEAYIKVAKDFGVTPMQLAYSFCKSRFFVTSTIIGATSLGQLNEDLEAFVDELPQEAQDAINKIHSENPNPQNIYT